MTARPAPPALWRRLHGRLLWRPSAVMTRTTVASASSRWSGRLVPVPPPGPADLPVPLFVADLPGGKVIGDLSLVATAEDVVLGDVQAPCDTTDPAAHGAVRRWRLRTVERIPGTGLVLAIASGDNYYHWLLESLPRLRLLELAGVPLADIDHILLCEHSLPVHHESLEQLGVPRARHRRMRKRRVQVFDRLVVPSMLSPPAEVPRWACDWVRAKFAPRSPGPPRRRLFVSRRQARGRRLANEAEIEVIARDSGFETVVLEHLDFAGQIRLFAEATAVVAVHGAGQANLVFAPPGTPVLELFSPDYVNDCYERLCRNLGHPHTRLVGETPPALRHRRRGSSDFTISPATFASALNGFLGH